MNRADLPRSSASFGPPAPARWLALGWALLGCEPAPGPQELESVAKPHATIAAPPTASAPSGPATPSAPLPPRDAAPDATLPPRDAPRVYAKSRNVWVRSGPTTETQWLGMLWFGGSVRIRDVARQEGPGCRTPWVPVEPRGWVCVDGDSATTDPDDPTLVATYPYRPRVDTPWPHRYAVTSDVARRYPTLPDAALQKSWELSFDRHMERVRAARTQQPLPPEFGRIDPSLSGQPAPSFPSLPSGLSEHRERIVARSALAYSAAFDHGDRAFLLAADLTWVPRDRVELVPPSEFQGLVLGPSQRLPLAFFRGRERPSYEKDATGAFVPAATRFDRLSYVALSGEVETSAGVRYHRVKDSQLWLSEREAVVPQLAAKTPWGAELGSADTTGRAPGGRNTWIEASVLSGWLIAYEGTEPVYVTLISAGRGGTPQVGKDPVSTASTPVGRFAITGKFKTATMESSSTPIVHGDVPWTQNFSGPHAIHSAYWHDDWGSLKSAGCVNVAPRDGKWLFEFTEPSVPEGWHGVRHVSRYGPATLLVLHE